MEEQKSLDVTPTPEPIKQPTFLDEVKLEREKMERVRDEIKVERDKIEQLRAEEIMSGRSFGGHAKEQPNPSQKMADEITKAFKR